MGIGVIASPRVTPKTRRAAGIAVTNASLKMPQHPGLRRFHPGLDYSAGEHGGGKADRAQVAWFVRDSSSAATVGQISFSEWQASAFRDLTLAIPELMFFVCS
jgi:hypothetical protein